MPRRLLVVGIVVAAAACASSSSSRGSDTTSTSTTVASSAARPKKIGDVVETPAGTSFTAYSWEQPITFGQSDSPPIGHEFAAADVGVCLGPEPVASATNVGPALFSVETLDHSRVTASVGRSRTPGLGATRLTKPGECVRGWVTFVLPTGTHPVRLIFASRLKIAWTIGPS